LDLAFSWSGACRPTASLAFVDPMVIAGILIGLVVGAAGAWLALRAQYASKLGVLDDARGSLETTMKALASDALASSSESFLKLAKSQLEQLQQKTTSDLEQRTQAVEHLVAPIKESLTKVDGKLHALELARTHAYSTLSSQVQQLAETQKELRSETGNLVSALRDRPNVRGRWGEIQLRRVVEMAGMLEYCDFQTQQHVATEDGRLRPDLVVKMPGGGSVVVDAKVAGQAYIESLECKDDEARLLKLHDHARQVRDHVMKLGAKNYWSQFERAPDFVVLFLPGETFLSAALEQDPALLEDSYANRVLIATPTTLIGLLRTVAYGWRQETIAQSAKEVSDLGRELYKRLATLTEHFSKVGDRLQSAVRAYNDSVGSFERSVLPGARRLKDHGISSSSELAELKEIDLTVRTVKTPELPAGVPDSAVDAA
jgi:DNA recombination protein RmuC